MVFGRLAEVIVITHQVPSCDILRPFQLEQSDIRGRFVRLGQTVDFVLKAHDYPEPVSRLLGELLVLAGALAGGLKFDGMFSLQIRSGGPVGLMVADCTNNGSMRGYASYDSAKVVDADSEDVASLLGTGVLALTVDQTKAGGQIYQGIVELSGQSLVDAMLVYFKQSEQVPTGIKVALDRDPLTGDWRAGAIVMQAMPEARTDDFDSEERWREAMMLLQTTSDLELVDPALAPDTVLFRLFHERGVRVFKPIALAPGCTCDEERVRLMLRSFSLDDFEDMRLPDGSVDVTCQFCGRGYHLDATQLLELLRDKRH
jgi:molecular chaperone Hsp33